MNILPSESEVKAAIVLKVAMYAMEQSLERHELDTAAIAALNSYNDGMSPIVAVRVGMKAVAAITADKIILTIRRGNHA